MDNIALIIVSFFAGLWNVLHEKFISIKQSICFFSLGFGFCYSTATIAETLGWDTKISTCVGYLVGMLSPSVYRACVRILEKAPDIVKNKLEK